MHFLNGNDPKLFHVLHAFDSRLCACDGGEGGDAVKQGRSANMT